ncbi:MAG: recombinase family protein [Mesorhizobium sp.]|uniref:recombinase family protein n=1 Tax=Mesorhizobium sp. TaxID=1871066 RepID=UPI000FE5438B|nr:recombinase family protein [Mesorhizobium sp.]RWC10382.1 MAG: recombinase family protein [Mesorhizobium sp.]
MAVVGYARVSSTGQDLATQIEKLKAAGATKIFEEKQSGTNKARPKLQECLNYLRDEGDTLLVTKLDRLARSAAHLHEIVEGLNVKGVGFKVLDDQSLDTTSRTGKLVFGILASIAEFETALRKERQMEGIAGAKAKAEAEGVPWNTGRPVKLDHDLIRKLKSDGLSVRKIAKEAGCSPSAVQKVLSN